MDNKINCLLISTGRTGSTALYNYISVAGELNLPSNKEPHHLISNVDKIAGVYDKLLSLYIDDEGDYFSLYKDSKIHLDASVGYFFYIESVIKKLSNYGEKPKVIYLYREPYSRARSLFNELKKKNISYSDDIYTDVKHKPPEGLWWERYYDNVDYDSVLSRIDEYFDDILLISYDEFSKNPQKATEKALNFMGLELRSTENCYSPINSSKEGIVSEKFAAFSFLGKLLPKKTRRLVKASLGVIMLKIFRKEKMLDGFLNRSDTQYKVLINKVRNKEYACLKK